jgi:hypothetical protein
VYEALWRRLSGRSTSGNEKDSKVEAERVLVREAVSRSWSGTRTHCNPIRQVRSLTKEVHCQSPKVASVLDDQEKSPFPAHFHTSDATTCFASKHPP